jgi:hypothetical protein
MMTARPVDATEAEADTAMAGMDMGHQTTGARHEARPPLAVMTFVSVAVLTAGLIISWLFGGLS